MYQTSDGRMRFVLEIYRLHFLADTQLCVSICIGTKLIQAADRIASGFLLTFVQH